MDGSSRPTGFPQPICSPKCAYVPNMKDELSAIVRTVLSTLPHGGPTLAAAWNEWDTNRRFQRVESFLKVLEQELAKLADRFDPSKIGDKELQLLEDTIQRVQSEHREWKRIGFAILLKSAWEVAPETPFEECMHFNRALDDFDDIHMNVLRYLNDLPINAPAPDPAGLAGALQLSPGAKKYTLMPALDLLCARYRFIERNWSLAGKGGAMLTTGNLGPENLANDCGHKITALGRRFIASITDDG
jgi:hypothetical protein